MGQTGVARLEKTGRFARWVTQEDLFALAFALDVPPVLLQLPADDERVEIVHQLLEGRDRVYAWIVGQRPLDAGRDPQRYRSGGWSCNGAPASHTWARSCGHWLT
jgi:hypothetical protein